MAQAEISNPQFRLRLFRPLVSLALCVIVLHGIVVYGEDERAGYQEPPRT